MPADTQTRLLRVLADGEFYRVGGHVPVKVDVRIIAATHQNLETLVQAGKFREDLFHRLNVIRIHIPRLADRREDIPPWPATSSAAPRRSWRSSRSCSSRDRRVHPQPAMAGQRAAAGKHLPLDHRDGLRPRSADRRPAAGAAEPATGRRTGDQLGAGPAPVGRPGLARGQSSLLDSAVPSFERIMIETALKHTAGRRRDAALLLGWGRNTLTRKIKELGMNVAVGMMRKVKTTEFWAALKIRGRCASRHKAAPRTPPLNGAASCGSDACVAIGLRSRPGFFSPDAPILCPMHL
jgi:two-component system nitrogen regulation response regulator GlnG